MQDELTKLRTRDPQFTRRINRNRMSVLIIAVTAASLVGFAPARSLRKQAPRKSPWPRETRPVTCRTIRSLSTIALHRKKVPEGRARRESSDGVNFNDKYDTTEP